jgi:hypothetical protein
MISRGWINHFPFWNLRLCREPNQESAGGLTLLVGFGRITFKVRPLIGIVQSDQEVNRGRPAVASR